MIQAVVFDLFGTLIDNLTRSGYRAVLAKMAIELDVPAEDFVRCWSATIKNRMIGLFRGMEDNILQACREIGASPSHGQISIATEIRLNYTRQCFAPRDDAISTLSELKATGIKVGLISDCTAEVPVLWGQSAFAPHFDALVFSCVEGTAKPDPRLYFAACERLGVAPDRCLYVGDGTSQELTGAAKVGMHPVLITGPELDIGGMDRSEFACWDGPRVTMLSEVLELVRRASRAHDVAREVTS